MSDQFRQTHGTIVFHPEEREQRWSAPNPEHEHFSDARHRARYPRPGQEPNYGCATLADTYAYLVSGCLTTKGAGEQLRMIRRATEAEQIREVAARYGISVSRFFREVIGAELARIYRVDPSCLPESQPEPPKGGRE